MDEQQHNERLWRFARQRAAFRKTFFFYFVINAFLWGVWWFTTGYYVGRRGYPWPVWVMLGWGIALSFQYYNAYGESKEDHAIKEYDKLKKEQENRQQ